MNIEIENVKEVVFYDVKKFGKNSGHAIVPKELIGKKIRVISLEGD